MPLIATPVQVFKAVGDGDGNSLSWLFDCLDGDALKSVKFYLADLGFIDVSTLHEYKPWVIGLTEKGRAALEAAQAGA